MLVPLHKDWHEPPFVFQLLGHWNSYKKKWIEETINVWIESLRAFDIQWVIFAITDAVGRNTIGRITFITIALDVHLDVAFLAFGELVIAVLYFLEIRHQKRFQFQVFDALDFRIVW